MEAARSSNASADDLRDLIVHMRDLERRVSALEQGAPLPLALPAPEPLPLERIELSADAIPMAGFALLGIAGAYLLRALSELGTLPRGLGVSAGLLYSAAWLWLAVRTPVARRFTVAARVSTSVLIFAPLVWESAVRFHTLPPWVAAALLLAFCVAAESISWRKNLETIAAVVPAACAFLALALLMGTYALAPFTLALVAIAAAVEFAAVEDRASGARWLVAGCADAAALVLTLLMSRRGGLPEGYAPVSIAFAAAIQGSLLTVYAGSAIARTVWRHRPFGWLEIAQTAAAFALGMGGIAGIAGLRAPVGLFALIAGAACYGIAWRAGSSRNRRVYAAFGLLLIACAPWLALSGIALTVAWALLAVAASFRADAHAAVLLWLALVGSQVAAASAVQLFDGGGPFPAVSAAIVIAAAGLCYWRPRRTATALFIAGALAYPAAGLLAALLRFPGSATIVLVFAAAILAWAGAAQRRVELVWLMYAFMAIDGLRMVWHDLPYSTAIELVAPLLLFGAALIVLPRILKAGRRKA